MKLNSIKLKLGVLVSSLFFVSMIASAQPCQGKGPHHGGHGDRMPDSCRAKCMIDNLAKDLSLNAEQKQKVAAIQKAHFDKIKVIRAQDSTCMAKNREQCQQLRSEMDNEIKAILTAEQKAKYDTIMSEKPCPRRDGALGDKPCCKGPRGRAPENK